MSITGDREDVNSIALTVTSSLLEKYGIKPEEIGRLDVGTETLIDKSKSTKTVLMELLGENLDIEGCTNVNACYGGTAALLNAFNYVSSPFWDGRYALVVACDIAAYAKGAARPTSGVGAVALLIGRDAPLVFEGIKSTHSVNAWDFYKPDHTVEYPVVDGKLSQNCYYEAIEGCYGKFADKMDKKEEVRTDKNRKSIAKIKIRCNYPRSSHSLLFARHRRRTGSPSRRRPRRSGCSMRLTTSSSRRASPAFTSATRSAGTRSTTIRSTSATRTSPPGSPAPSRRAETGTSRRS